MSMLNNINIAGLSEFVSEIKADNQQSRARYGVQLNWQSGTKSIINTKNVVMGEHKLVRDFSFTVDEPSQLLGINSAPSPAEYMLGGLAGCMAVTFLAGATAMNIEIDALSLDIDGEIDLQGFLGLDDDTNAGFPELSFVFNVSGNGTQEQYDKLLMRVNRHSPNFNTMKNTVNMVGRLEKTE